MIRLGNKDTEDKVPSFFYCFISPCQVDLFSDNAACPHHVPRFTIRELELTLSVLTFLLAQSDLNAYCQHL